MTNSRTPDLDGCNVVILCHSDKKDGRRESGSGPIAPLLRFFSDNKARYIFLIEQPHPNTKLSLDCTMEVYRDGRLLSMHTFERFRWLYDIPPERRVSRTYIRLKLRDIVASRHLLSIIRKQYPDCGPIHFLIGMECINALIGHWCRKELQVEKVIYYTFDWAPRRYQNPLMNWVFLSLDKWACSKADVAWNVTDAIERARREVLHYDMNRMATQIVVPYGAEFRRGLVRDYDELEKFRVIFSGGHHIENGAQFLPDIARHVQDGNPKVRFIITGDGPLTGSIKAKMREYGVHNVEFTGYITGRETLDQLTCECLIGLAPYPDTLVSTKKYGDVMKIRIYFACGLVVVSTHVPPSAREIRDEGLGIVTGVDAREMADAILRLCSDEALLWRYRDNVIRKAMNHNWASVYSRALGLMEEERRSALAAVRSRS